jgi:hypothetical protein
MNKLKLIILITVAVLLIPSRLSGSKKGECKAGLKKEKDDNRERR